MQICSTRYVLARRNLFSQKPENFGRWMSYIIQVTSGLVIGRDKIHLIKNMRALTVGKTKFTRQAKFARRVVEMKTPNDLVVR